MRWLALIAGLGFITGCEPVEPIDTDLTTSVTATGTPGTTGTTGPQYDDQGNIVLMVRRAEPENPTDRVQIAGVFAETTKSWLNLSQCLALQEDTFCTQDLPAVEDDWIAVEAWTDELIGTLTTVDVGNPLRLGPYTVSSGQPDGMTVYWNPNGAGAGLPVDGAMDLSFSGGALGDFEAEDVVPVPDPMIVTSPDPTRPQTLTGDPFPLTWTPGLVGKVYLAVMSDSVQRLYWLQDDGNFELDVGSLGLADQEQVTLTLGRWSQAEIDHSGATLELMVQDNQTIRALYRDLPNRMPIEPANSCADAAFLPAVQSGLYYGRMQSATNTLSPSGCVVNGNGPEMVLRAELNPDGELNVDYQAFDANTVGYLMTSCGDFGTCLDGSNVPGVNTTESLSWINDTAVATDVYIVLDTTAGPVNDLFLLNVDIIQVNADQLVDSCADAIYQTSLTSFPAGTDRYVGSIAAFNNYADPAGYCNVSAPGAEGMTKLELLPGETVEATVEMPGADPVLYLLYNCAISMSCPVGADADTSAFETLTYTNTTAGTEIVYLVVDSTGVSTSYILDLLIQ